ncbi:MAG: hypothetical protein GY935_14025 [Gammaproteobacteria bacterium]|nr:hypothetical protein [Gammaproteobacteria bacterium]
MNLTTQHLRSLLVALGLLFASASVQATTVNVSSGSCDGSVVGQTCALDALIGDPDNLLFPSLTGLELLYRADSFFDSEDLSLLSTTPSVEAGTYRDSYSTEFGWGSVADAYSSALISYDGSSATPITECLTITCYLVVRGETDRNPSAYLFNLALNGWDGDANKDMPLNLTGFWLTSPGAAISHVAIYGSSLSPSPIPVPAALWLFGTALIGFIGISRRTKV